VTRARLAFVAGLALAASAACGGKSSAPARVNFRLPSAIAAFQGRTRLQPLEVRPYLAVANEGRNDLTLVDATNDVVLDAPVLLRPLAIPFADRPALLASASLGDGGADLLVGVSQGSSVLQLVQTWEPTNTVQADPANGAVELGADVLRIIAIPPEASEPPQTVRLAAALAGERLAVVRYKRAADGEKVEVDTGFGTGGVVVHGLGLEPADLAADPDGQHVYAATLDPIGPSAVQGVARIDVVNAAEPWPVRGLDARGPTRLVAAATLMERRNDLPVEGDPGATDLDPGAFTGQLPVTRVYAVLDEASCGFDRKIDCGVVMLDPIKAPAAGDDDIPEDWAGWMPYRAPIAVRARPLAIAVAGPPAVAPADWTFGSAFMRLVLGGTIGSTATTAVGIVALENGSIDFLDLGRFKAASTTFAPVQAFASALAPAVGNRIWIKDPSTGSAAASIDAASKAIAITPGYALDEAWAVSFQGALPGLKDRAAEVALTDQGDPWLAIQYGDGIPGQAGRTPSGVARLYHPELAVQVGDIVTIKVDSFKVGGVTQCDGLPPPGTSKGEENVVAHEFETVITQLLAPDPRWPGGAVVLGERTKGPDELEAGDPALPPKWDECWNALTGALKTQGYVKGLQVTVNAGRLLLVGARIGYAGRPELDAEYVLRYKREPPCDPPVPSFACDDEDALGASCPLVDWDGSFPLAPALDCGGAGCPRDVCEELVLARKVRRRHHLSEDCHKDRSNVDSDCLARYPAANFTFPIVNGPALRLTVIHDTTTTSTTKALFRGLTLSFSTGSGVVPLSVSAGGATTRANGAITFDRSPYPDPSSGVNPGYRFYVSYPGNQIADVSPSLNPIASNTIR
jgi:hypothetical protein